MWSRPRGDAEPKVTSAKGKLASIDFFGCNEVILLGGYKVPEIKELGLLVDLLQSQSNL